MDPLFDVGVALDWVDCFWNQNKCLKMHFPSCITASYKLGAILGQLVTKHTNIRVTETAATPPQNIAHTELALNYLLSVVRICIWLNTIKTKNVCELFCNGKSFKNFDLCRVHWFKHDHCKFLSIKPWWRFSELWHTCMLIWRHI